MTRHLITILHIASISVSLFFIITGFTNTRALKEKTFSQFLFVTVFLSIHNLMNTIVYYGMQFSLPFLEYPHVTGTIVYINLCMLLSAVVKFTVRLFPSRTSSVLLSRINMVIIAFYASGLLFFHLSGIAGVLYSGLAFYDIIIFSQFAYLFFLGIYLYVLLTLDSKKERTGHSFPADIFCRLRTILPVFAPGLMLQLLHSTSTFNEIRTPVDFIALATLPVFMITITGISTAGLLAHRETAQPEAERVIDLGLTKRETEVVDQMIRGYSYNRIAENLYISLPTVKTHLNSVYRKTHTRNKIELYNLLGK